MAKASGFSTGPIPPGRPVEGLILRSGWESFVGAAEIPMRHGLTLGELGAWFIDHFKLDVDYRVIEMADWQPEGPGFGWPQERIWINPSPNAANLNMARAYAGTVMLEGTTLSEGRGTTRPLELFGAPDIEAGKVIAQMHALAPGWLEGCKLREIWFEPTFHKHVGKLCNGVHIHAEGPFYDHTYFKPWRRAGAGFQGDPDSSIRTTISGATSPTNMSSTSSRSTSSTARRCSANGSTSRTRRRTISTRSLSRTSGPGKSRASLSASIDRRSPTRASPPSV